jgi:hypothetical protein
VFFWPQANGFSGFGALPIDGGQGAWQTHYSFEIIAKLHDQGSFSDRGFSRPVTPL